MYRPETSIAEKTEAMVRLGVANSRMKDFVDVYSLAASWTFDGDTLRRAVSATFSRRETEIPRQRPLALTTEFASDPQKQVQWTSFVRRTRRPDLRELAPVIERLNQFLWPVLQAAAQGDVWRVPVAEWRAVGGAVAAGSSAWGATANRPAVCWRFETSVTLSSGADREPDHAHVPCGTRLATSNRLWCSARGVAAAV